MPAPYPNEPACVLILFALVALFAVVMRYAHVNVENLAAGVMRIGE